MRTHKPSNSRYAHSYFMENQNGLSFHEGGNMKLELTAVYRKVPEGYIAFIEDLPGANTQGATLEEARSNLKEAALLVLETNRTLSAEELRGEKRLGRR